MSNQIKEILEDIYIIDPSLKSQEKKLIKIMQELIKQKPDTNFDEAFKEELKQKLLERADQLSGSTKRVWWLEALQVRNLAYVSVGAALTFLLALPFVWQKNQGVENFVRDKQASNQLAFESGIKNLQDNAFGSLVDRQFADDGKWEGSFSEESASQEAGPGIGGGGGIAAPMLNAVESKKMVSDTRMIMPYEPEKIEYKYIFNPEDISLPESTVAVYKQINSPSSAQSMGRILNNFDLGVIDLKNFSAAEVKSIHMAEEKEFGYYISINLVDNSVNISQNWEQWPRLDRECKDEACFQRYRLKPSDVPSDKKIIDVSSRFVEKMGIDLGLYGEPEVDRRYEKEIERYPERETWVPDMLSVIYPLRIEDQDVHDYSGRKSGLHVAVDIRNMKVSSLNSLRPYNFASSNYEAMTDVEKIKEVINQGGRRYYFGIREEEQADKIVEITLGKPVYSLLRYHRYNEETRQSDELLIPAMILPVEKISDNSSYFYQESVVVPLVKEIFEKEFADNGSDGQADPMPLLRGGKEPMVEPMIDPEL